jgi:hypothetical protein
MGTYVNKVNQALAGTGGEVVVISDKFENNQITFEGIASGTATVQAKAEDSTAFEDVVNGTIADLSTTKTLKIDSIAIAELSITVSGACTVYIKQTSFKDE